MDSLLRQHNPVSGSPWAAKLVGFLSIVLVLQIAVQDLSAMWSTTTNRILIFAGVSTAAAAQSSSAAQSVDLSWHPPNTTAINNLTQCLSSSGVYGFIYNSSVTPDSQYGEYNWCNMPHVRKQEYQKPTEDYGLVYVELIHRHHKRTPYASNAFPVESYHWDCDDESLFYFGRPSGGHQPAESYWTGSTSPLNPFVPSGWIGTCQFPQITAGGLDDSWQHGADLYGVYHDLLGFLPGRDAEWRSKVRYRVTQNVITSQVAGMVINGMWGTTEAVPLVVQAAGVDSLEPQYACPAASSAFSGIKSSTAWTDHLSAAASLYATLDDISGVSHTDAGFHASFDHYYDNLSARQCHAGKPLPCKLVVGGSSGGAAAAAAAATNSTTCVTQDVADAVYRLGHWEYSRLYRDDARSLAASVGAWGVWVAELAAHLRAVVVDGSGLGSTLWYHNIAHDGSLSRLLSILQVDVMVWPGMGSEVVFEVWQNNSGRKPGRAELSPSGFYVRVLFGGRVLRSSNPSLGSLDMIPVETLLAYFDGLVGKNASLMMGKCNGTIPL